MGRTKQYWEKIFDVNAWLGIHISQLAFTRNLIITLSTASLGYAFSRYKQGADATINQSKLEHSICLFVAALLIGLVLALIQTEIFRRYRLLSRKIAQSKEKEDDLLPDGFLSSDFDRIGFLEKWGGLFFIVQVALFIIGIIDFTRFVMY